MKQEDQQEALPTIPPPLPHDEGQSGEEVAIYLQSLHAQEESLLADYTQRTRSIEQEIANRWGQAFAHFDLLVIVAQRALGHSDNICYAGAATRKDFMYEALHALAVRACQTAKEVRALMAKGYAPAATTRWRALHEIHIVAQLIHIHGAPLAERYLRHNIVEKNKLANAVEEVYSTISQPLTPPLVDAIAAVRAEYTKLQTLYAHDRDFFRGDYGWTAGFVTGQRLVDLERAAGLADRRFAYRIVSDSIHPNIAGAFAGSQSTSEGEAMVLGPSSDGMTPLGPTTAISLVAVEKIFLQQALHYGEQQSAIRRELALIVLTFDALLADIINTFQAVQ